MNEPKGRIGSSFADFLSRQGIRAEVERRALSALKREQAKTPDRKPKA